jgi:hypothetical protein
VLSVRPKITDLSFHLFGRSLHPELFNLGAGRTFERENYSLNVNITTDGHWITYQHKNFVFSEVCAGVHHPLPTSQLLLSHPVEGVCNNDLMLVNGLIEYQTKVQLENVDAKTFVTIQQHLGNQSEHAQPSGLVYRFESNGRLNFGAVSYVDVQSFIHHVKIRAFHTFPDTCAVLKSETLFRIKQSGLIDS